MKTSIKKIIVLVAVLMLMSLSFINVSKAAEQVPVKVNGGEVEVEKNITLEVVVTEDWSVEEGGILLKFNSSELQYVSNTVPTIANLMLVANNRSDGVIAAFAATTADPVTLPKGTVLATVTFKALSEGTKVLEVLDDSTGSSIGTVNVVVKSSTPTPTKAPTPTVAPTQQPTKAPEPTTKPTQAPTPTKTPTASQPEKVPSATPSTTPSTSTNASAKDDTPKTGVNSIVPIVIAVITVSAIALAIINKKK